jgi:hypothetical protein
MICPHCKRPLRWQISASIKKKVKKLAAKGYTHKDISQILGGIVSPTSVGRIIKEKEDKAP